MVWIVLSVVCFLVSCARPRKVIVTRENQAAIWLAECAKQCQIEYYRKGETPSGSQTGKLGSERQRETGGGRCHSRQPVRQRTGSLRDTLGCRGLTSHPLGFGRRGSQGGCGLRFTSTLRLRSGESDGRKTRRDAAEFEVERPHGLRREHPKGASASLGFLAFQKAGHQIADARHLLSVFCRLTSVS